MSLFEHIQKYVPPPVMYLGGVALLWYQISFALTTDANVEATVRSPIFRYGVAIILSVLIILDVRSRHLSVLQLLRGWDGIHSLLAYISLLCVLSIVAGLASDYAKYLRAKSRSSELVVYEPPEPTELKTIKCSAEPFDDDIAIVCFRYAWTKAPHYDIAGDLLSVESGTIQLAVGHYRFVAIAQSDPSLFDEQDVVVDRLTPSETTLRFRVPKKDEMPGILAGMVEIDEGTFLRGCNEDVKWAEDRKPAVDVFLRAFYIDRFETTVPQYAEFVAAQNYPPPEFIYPDRTGYEQLGLNKPIVGLSWYDAHAYAKYRGKRLPLEAEWEKSARSGAANTFPWGNDFDSKNFNPIRRYNHAQLKQESWFAVFSKLLLVDVDGGANKKDVTKQGVVGMAGNAREWCFDQYRTDYNSAGADTPDWKKVVRIVRGGVIDNESRLPGEVSARADYRGLGHPSKPYNNVGVRCVRSKSYQWAMEGIRAASKEMETSSP